jgi:hypothetical protein
MQRLEVNEHPCLEETQLIQDWLTKGNQQSDSTDTEAAQNHTAYDEDEPGIGLRWNGGWR